MLNHDPNEPTPAIDLEFPDIIHIEALHEKEPSPKGQAFESDEHRDIGNFAFHQFMTQLSDTQRALIQPFLMLDEKETKLHDPDAVHSSDVKEKTALSVKLPRFPFAETLALSPGEIVALAGDFFAALDPISFGQTQEEQAERFEAAFATLFSTDVNQQKLTQEKIQKVIAHIEDDAAKQGGTSPHAHWSVRFVRQFKNKAGELLEKDNIQYAMEMADEHSVSGFWHSPYFELAAKNFDHFGEEAKVAYLTGHHIALKMVQDAADPNKTNEEKQSLLRGAFLRELYACHFLTDLFAAGHMRVPRKQILNYLTRSEENDPSFDIHATPDLNHVSSLHLTQAGLFARKMHDEEGDKGLYVHAKDKPDQWWQAFGDGNYYGEQNRENAKQVCEVMKLALTDVLLAYEGKETKLDNHLDHYIPEPYPANDQNPNQPKPMFYVKDNQLHCRGDLVKQLKDEGIEGLKEGIPYTAQHLGLISSRFFNVSTSKASQVAHKTKEGAVHLVDQTQAKAEELIGRTQEQVEALYEQFQHRGVRCVIS